MSALNNHELKLVEDLFFIPEGDDYILYAPLERVLFIVNKAAIGALQSFKQGEYDQSDGREDFFKQLIGAGIIIDGNQPRNRGHVTFHPEHGDFDPGGITLLLTTTCSLRCIYCYSSGGDRPRTMSWDTAKAAIDWIADHAAVRGKKRFFVNFHGGGEVTTAEALMKRCVAYARERANAQGATVTFESGLNGVMSIQMLDWVIENLDGATVSLDGLPEIHNHQRPLPGGGDSFDRVSTSLRQMDARGFKYGIRTTVTQAGLARFAESVEFMSKSFGATVMQVEPVFPVGRALENSLAVVEPEAFVREFRQARRLARAHGKDLRYSGARFFMLTNVFCKASGRSFAVTPEGFVTSCYEVTDAADPRSALFFYGRLDQHSMKFVFDKEKLIDLSRLNCESRPFCANCFCKWHCAGDCPSKLAASGDPWDPSANPRCHINRELTKDQMREYMNLS